MRLRLLAGLLTAGILWLGALHAVERPFREYPGVEYDNFPLPSDWRDKTEWAFARLMYPSGQPLASCAGTGAAAWTGRKAKPVGRRTIRAPTGISPRRIRRLTRIARALGRTAGKPGRLATTCTTGPGSTPCRWASGI